MNHDRPRATPQMSLKAASTVRMSEMATNSRPAMAVAPMVPKRMFPTNFTISSATFARGFATAFLRSGVFSSATEAAADPAAWSASFDRRSRSGSRAAAGCVPACASSSARPSEGATLRMAVSIRSSSFSFCFSSSRGRKSVATLIETASNGTKASSVV